MMKLCALLSLLVLASASAVREEHFVWGDWTLKLEGSRYTHSWSTTEHVGGFESDTFVVKVVTANSNSIRSRGSRSTKRKAQAIYDANFVDGAVAQNKADWCMLTYGIDGVEALYTGDGHFIRTLSCDNNDAAIISKTFTAAGFKQGDWTLSLLGSSYTHSWESTTFSGTARGFTVKEITSDPTQTKGASIIGTQGTEIYAANSCMSTFGINAVESLYTMEGVFIRTLSCNNQDAHVVLAACQDCTALSSVSGTVSFTAYTTLTFDNEARSAFKETLAQSLGVSLNQITIVHVSATGSQRRRLTSGAGVVVSYSINNLSTEEVTSAMQNTNNLISSSAAAVEFESIFETEVANLGSTVPAGNSMSAALAPSDSWTCSVKCTIETTGNSNLIKVHHDTASGHSSHRCFKQGTDCVCMCA